MLDRIEHDSDDGARVRRLVVRAQAGEDIAFGELYILLYDPVRRWLEIALKERDEAYDAAQLVFERALRALPRYVERPGSSFRAWVFSIARNLALDHLRAAARRTDATDPTVLVAQIDRLRGPGSDTAAEAEGEAEIATMIEDLPRAQRTVLMLRFVSDFPTVDIAEVLAMSPDAVRHTQHRALRALGRSLAAKAAGAPPPSV